MKKVYLADKAGNRFSKRVGFSWGYLFLGPFWLLFHLRFEGLLLIPFYLWLLPLPGVDNFLGWLSGLGLSGEFFDLLSTALRFFRFGYHRFLPYLGLAIIALLHLLLSFTTDNWLLKKKIAKKGWAPVSEDDARELIYIQAVKPNVLLAKEKAEKEHLHEQAEKIWEDNNLSYTMMLTRKQLGLDDTSSASSPAPGGLSSADLEARHNSNASLLARGVISKEEYEILEKRNRALKEAQDQTKGN